MHAMSASFVVVLSTAEWVIVCMWGCLTDVLFVLLLTGLLLFHCCGEHGGGTRQIGEPS